MSEPEEAAVAREKFFSAMRTSFLERENEREKVISVARDKLITAVRARLPEADIWKTEYERVVRDVADSECAMRAMEDYERAICVVPLRRAPDWTSKLSYSKWVHDNTGAKTPIDQMSIYGAVLDGGAVLGGIVYARKSWVRANHLLMATQLPIDFEGRKLHKALAWVTNSELENATMVAKTFRTQGILAGVRSATYPTGSNEDKWVSKY